MIEAYWEWLKEGWYIGCSGVGWGTSDWFAYKRDVQWERCKSGDGQYLAVHMDRRNEFYKLDYVAARYSDVVG